MQRGEEEQGPGLQGVPKGKPFGPSSGVVTAPQIEALSAAYAEPFTPHVVNPCLEEPDARVGHVRIRGGTGKATTWGYPTSSSTNALSATFTTHFLGDASCSSAHDRPARLRRLTGRLLLAHSAPQERFRIRPVAAARRLRPNRRLSIG